MYHQYHGNRTLGMNPQFAGFANASMMNTSRYQPTGYAQPQMIMTVPVRFLSCQTLGSRFRHSFSRERSFFRGHSFLRAIRV